MAYDDATMAARRQMETPSHHSGATPLSEPSARDKRLRQSSNIKSLKKGGAGESGFCYEAGASAEVAPKEALGSVGWGEKKKTPKAQHAG